MPSLSRGSNGPRTAPCAPGWILSSRPRLAADPRVDQYQGYLFNFYDISEVQAKEAGIQSFE